MNYRPDIDGLRSFAVLSVLIFHINATFMPGGFTGVDIFFVISGFLITSILLKEIKETATVNIREFYRRRIKRILPSFFLIAVISSVVAYLFFLPEDLINFAKSLRAGLVFTSNHYFADKDDYFDPGSDEFPLLHTWSLSVEEQFYFIWPLILFWLLKLKSAKKIISFLAFTIFSSVLLGQLWGSASLSDAQRAYFFLPTRMGELLIGCLVAYLVQNKKVKLSQSTLNLVSITGLILVVASFYVINKDTIFPGYWALLPCVGAALIIWSGHIGQGLVHSMLSLKPLVWVGLHSYAIYLWHWPLLAFYRYLSGRMELGLTEGIVVTGLSIGLSMLSRAMIEKPFNHSKKPFKQIALQYFAAPSFVLLAMSQLVISKKGMPERIFDVNDREFILNRRAITHQCHSNHRTDCWSRKDSSVPKVLIFGDSHGAHYTPFLREVLSDYNVYSKTTSSCPPVLHPSEIQRQEMKKFSKSTCAVTIAEVNKVIENEDIKAVFLAARWSSQEAWTRIDESLKETILYLKKKNIQVYVFNELPSFNDKEVLLFYRTNYGPGQEYFENPKVEFARRKLAQSLTRVAVENGAILLDVYQPAKVPDFRPPFYQNRLIFRDGHHLTKEGSTLLGQRMKSLMLEKIKIE